MKKTKNVRRRPGHRRPFAATEAGEAMKTVEPGPFIIPARVFGPPLWDPKVRWQVVHEETTPMWASKHDAPNCTMQIVAVGRSYYRWTVALTDDDSHRIYALRGCGLEASLKRAKLAANAEYKRLRTIEAALIYMIHEPAMRETWAAEATRT